MQWKRGVKGLKIQSNTEKELTGSTGQVHSGINKSNYSKMKRIIFVFILGCCFLQLTAQTSQDVKPSTLVFHVFYDDFKTAQLIRTSSLKNVLDNHLWSRFGEMQMGFGVNYLKGLNKNLDFIATFDGSSTDYLFKNGTTNGSSAFLLDANVAVNLKMLSDRHKIVPYLSGGGGFSLYQGKTGFYLPAGAGIQFHFYNSAFVFTDVQYRNALTSQVNNHFQYNIGVGASLGKRKPLPAKTVEKPLPPVVKKEVVVLPKDLLVTVTDEATGQPLPYVAVTLGSADCRMQYGSTDDYGRVTFMALIPDSYTVSGSLNHINSTSQTVKKENFTTNESQVGISLTHNDPRFTLSGVVINKTKNIPEGGAEVKVTNSADQTFMSVQSHQGDGVFRTQLLAGSDFTVVGKKANYISNIEKITTKGLNRSATLYVKLELAIEEAKAGQSIQLKNIYFEVGKADLNTAVSSDLDKLIQFLKDNPATRLEIQGHTDNMGSLVLNNRLSQSRADSVVEYLTKNGIDRGRLIAKGYGPLLPVADNTTTEGRAQNRRVVMKVLD